MKVNLPVNEVERPYPRGATLVSKTDLQGVITYANDAFVNISGYSRDELVGQNHNIIRHPDMPEEAFADLWQAIKAGLPWQGLVKNRCKNGDYYWVKALIVPVRVDNQTIGHMSVRTEPTAEEKRHAIKHYQAVKDKRAKLKSTSLAEIVARVPFNLRYALFVSWMVALAIAAGVAGFSGYKEFTIAIGALALISGIGSVWFMAYTVANPLREAIGYFDQIAQGRLGNEIPLNRPDEVGRVLGGLAVAQTHMRVMIDEIRLSTLDVESRCEQVDVQVSHATELSRDQAERIVHVNSAMGALAASVSHVAQTAETSADSARSTMAVVNEGNTRMTRSIEATDQVSAAVQSSGEDIAKLSSSIDQIGTMTGIVKEIADQTNLLALNAAIEAARAGEQGRGFAVVADEVRKLAERTTATTVDIDSMVDNIQSTAKATVSAMNNAVEQVQLGRGFIEQTNQSFTEITALSQAVTDTSSGIADAAHEQSVATGEVAQNVEQISHLIEENSASFVQVRDAVKELRLTADKLRDVVAHFRDRD